MTSEIVPQVARPDRGGPAALGAVAIYATLPWIAGTAYAVQSGTFSGRNLFIGCVAVWLMIPALFVSVADLPRQRWPSAVIWFAATGLVPFAAAAVVARGLDSEPEPLGWIIASYAGAWFVLLATAIGFGLLCAASEPAFRWLAGRGPFKRVDETPDSWRKAFVFGVASTLLLGPALWWMWGDLFAAAVVSVFVVGLNVVAWLLRSCPPDAVLQWVVLLAIPALAAMLVGPPSNRLWVLLVGLAYSAALGFMCSRAQNGAGG